MTVVVFRCIGLLSYAQNPNFWVQALSQFAYIQQQKSDSWWEYVPSLNTRGDTFWESNGYFKLKEGG